MKTTSKWECLDLKRYAEAWEGLKVVVTMKVCGVLEKAGLAGPFCSLRGIVFVSEGSFWILELVLAGGLIGEESETAAMAAEALWS
jgi:hypothetical protein